MQLLATKAPKAAAETITPSKRCPSAADDVDPLHSRSRTKSRQCLVPKRRGQPTMVCMRRCPPVAVDHTLQVCHLRLRLLILLLLKLLCEVIAVDDFYLWWQASHTTSEIQSINS